MKTAAEFTKLFGWGDDVTMMSLTDLIEARDVEHRAEIERLKGELAEARGFVRRVSTMGSQVIQPTRLERDAMAMVAHWDAPPPAESTPTPCTASAGSCNSPKTCGEAGKCIDARMREVVGAPAESTPAQCQRETCDGGIKCRCGIGRNPAPPDDIRERPTVVYATQAQLDERMRSISTVVASLNEFVRKLAQNSATQGAMVTLENKVAALEAKGEPVTFDHEYVNDGKKRCEVCGLPEGQPTHTKGAKP